jgi:hypothetical protein
MFSLSTTKYMVTKSAQKKKTTELRNYSSGVHRFFPKFRSHLKIIGARIVPRSKFQPQDPPISGVAVEY